MGGKKKIRMNQMIDGNQSRHPMLTAANQLLGSGFNSFSLALRSKVVSISIFSLLFLDVFCAKQMIIMSTLVLN